MAVDVKTVELAAPPGTSSMPKKKSSSTAGCGFLGVAFGGVDLLGAFLGVVLGVVLGVFPVLIVDAANMSSKPPHSSCGDGVLAFGRAGTSGVKSIPGSEMLGSHESAWRAENYLYL